MVVTDLDGTLLDSRGRLAPANRRVLEQLGENGILRVVATGRSLYSAHKVLDDDFPIDYLVFSSGAGVVDWRSGELLLCHHMQPAEVKSGVSALLARALDFMVHLGIPDNHHFLFHRSGAENPDFDRRCERYGPYGRPWNGDSFDGMEVSQLLAIQSPEQESRYQELAGELSSLNVVLTTSPLDHRSHWIEIFPPAVSKSLAADWIRRRHEIARSRVLAIGNDYNDRDLLDWAGRSYVVANAPAPLKSQYAMVASNDEEGFAEAVAAQVWT